jgi:hypothetical protein
VLDYLPETCQNTGMTIEKDLPELCNFQVVAVHRKTGEPQFVTLQAPSQKDADDFVGDITPEWIVIRDNKDLLDN